VQAAIPTILITGSTGNIGSELTRQLANSSSGLNLKAVVRSGDATSIIHDDSKNKAKMQQVVMDFDTPETMREGLKNVDKLFLLTPTHPKLVEFTSNLVNEAKKAGGVKHIVKLSHIRADAPKDDAARITITNLHREAEKIIEDSEISYTFLRPNFFFQNFINFYGPMIKSQGSFSLPAGHGKVSFVDVRDIASVAAIVLTKERDGEEHMIKAYDVTGPESLTYAEAANILSIEAGKKIDYSNISEEDARRMIKEMGMNDWHTNVLVELLRITREGYLSNISSAVEQVTGNKPISFHQFAKDHASAFQ
jgi:uncharacterized protein YbjT (DUF2867 family)